MNVAECFKLKLLFTFGKEIGISFIISGEANKKIFDFRQFSKFFDYFRVGRRATERGL